VRNPGRDIPRAIFWQRVFHHGNLSALTLWRCTFADERNRGKYLCAWFRRRRVFGSLGDPINPFDHGDFHAELPECHQLFCSRTLHAMSCDGLFFRRVSKGERGRDATLSLLLSTIVGVLFVLIAFLKAQAFGA